MMDVRASAVGSLSVNSSFYQPFITYQSLSFDTLMPSGHPLNLTPYISPLEWSKARKHLMLYLACLAATSTTYAAGSYSPASRAMSEERKVSEAKVLLGITTFCIGFAITPMIFTSFSEINGRYPVFIGVGIILLSS
jgi:hypothetical protein